MSVWQSGVWIVIPVYNEGADFAGVIKTVSALPVSVVVVDDGSTSVDYGVETEGRCWLLRHSINLGQGAALQTGIDFALARGATAVVTFDSDGQHDAADISTLLDTLYKQKVDFVLGSRFLGTAPGIPITRKIILKAGVLFTRLFSRIRVTDTHNGLRAMTRRGAANLGITLNRMEHASQILDQIVASGLRYVEAPVTIRYSEESLAKGQSSSAAVRMAAKLIVEKLR